MTLETKRLRTVEQIRGFLDGNGEVDFRPLDRDAAYGFVRRTLVRLDYDALGRAGKGPVREFLGKATGLSRAQVTRLIGQYRATGRVEDRRARTAAGPSHGSTRRRTSGCRPTPTGSAASSAVPRRARCCVGSTRCSATRASSGCRDCPRRTCTTCGGRGPTARGARPSSTRGRRRCASASRDGRTRAASPATCAWTRCTRGLRPRWRPQRGQGRLRHQPVSTPTACGRR